MNSANVGRNHPDNRFNVNDWNADNGNDNVGAVPAVVSSKIKVAWRILSILQAFYLFLEGLTRVLDNFYF